jgi:hypothetical protein
VDGYEAVYEQLATGNSGQAPGDSGDSRVWSQVRSS